MPRFYRICLSVFSRLLLCFTLALPFAATAQQVHVAPVDINSASAETLADALQGVGMAKAEAIVAFRDQHGPFEKADDLVEVKGIGGATLAKNLERIQVN